MAEEDEKKDNASAIGKSFLNFIDKSVEASRTGLRAAGNAIGDFGDKSVLRIELTQLNAKMNKLYAELGKVTYERLSAGDESQVSMSDEKVKSIVDEMKKVSENIHFHEMALKIDKK